MFSSLAAFKLFSLSFGFCSFTIMCIGVDLFVFLLGIFLAFHILGWCSQPLFTLQILPLLHFFSFWKSD